MYELVSGSQTKRWQEILNLLNITDIYYTCEYLSSALKLDPGEALIFYYTDDTGEGEIVYPFIKRQLKEINTLFYDITSPFGYGGPVAKIAGDRYKLASNFLKVFSDYCKTEKIIAEYIRFHPLMNNAEFFVDQMELIPVQETYTFQLDIIPEESDWEIKASDEHSSDIVVKELGTVKHMFDFLVIYYSAVRKNDYIDSYYFFTNDYFESLVSALGPHLHLFGAYKDNELLSAWYVLTKGEGIYYHLSGNLEGRNLLEAEKAIMGTIVKWGMEKNFRYFNLIGKQAKASQSFGISSKNPSAISLSTFFIAHLVHDQEIYQEFYPMEKMDLLKRYGNV